MESRANPVMNLPHTERVTCFAPHTGKASFPPLILTGSDDGSIRLWDATEVVDRARATFPQRTCGRADVFLSTLFLTLYFP